MKHTCPHCGEKTISPFKKAMAGNPQSRGTVCPNCGKRSTNELKSAVFHAIVSAIALVFIIYQYVAVESIESNYYSIAAILIALVVPRIVDAFFFKLVPAIRLDYR